MKKSIFLALVAVFAACAARAAEVTPSMAVTAANAWAARNAEFNAGTAATNVVTVCDTNAAQTVLWHQVSMTGGGCLIMAPVTEIEPVVAALDNDPGELPAAHPLRGILTGDIRRRLRFLGLYKEDSSGATLLSAAAASDEAQAWAATERAKWRRLGVGGATLMSVQDAVEDITVQIGIVDGFEKDGRLTHWSQSYGGGGYCYNYYTPNHAVCGCVATAAAAMMQFFGVTNCPSGYVNEHCTYNGNPYSAATVGGAYDWNLFTNCTTKADYDKLSLEQRELLGRVAYDAGVGVTMHWTDGASGAGEAFIANAYRNLFGFKHARYVGLGESPTEEMFRKLIYAQCWAGVPVGMGIEGHSVVACGYGIDADGVERVRVFMGWGGSGDAWYALPYIDTKATEGGSNYLSEVVDGVVTLIGYDTDDVVPVVGQVNMGGVAITVQGVVDTNGATRVIAADANGYFATRVPPTMTSGSLECMGKVATYAIGEAAAAAENTDDAETLCEALPEWLMPWPLLNATVCFTLEEAIEAALAENKAILRVSGTGAETNTQVVLDYIYSLDQDNVEDFTNRFVYIYSDAGSKAGDVSPSFGVYLPQGMDADDRWVSYNGMLSYDWRVDATNDVAAAQACVQAVLDVGWDLYQRKTGNTVLTIAAPSFEDGEPTFTISYEGATNTVEETPAAGAYTNAFKHGQTVTVTSESELTNETAGVVLSCSGWTLTNETTGVVQKGSGSTAEFTVSTNETVSLLWSVATNAVYVKISINDITGFGDNAVTPGSGWYPYGEVVAFMAEPDTDNNYYLDSWTGGDGRKEIGLVEGVSVAGLQLLTDGLAPFSAMATFRREANHYAPPSTNEVTVKSWALDRETMTAWDFYDEAEVPETTVVAVPGETLTVADGDSVEVPAISVGFTVPSTVEDSTGGVWRCIGWDIDDDGKLDGSGSAATFIASTNATLCWYWELEKSEEPEEPEEKTDEELAPVAPDGAELLTIYANDDGTMTVEANVANGYSGYWYSLYAADALGGTWGTVEKVQTGYTGTGIVCPTSDGEVKLSIQFAPSEAKKFYKVVVDREDPTK